VPYGAGVFLIAAAVAVVVMMVFQVLQYFHGRQLISGSHLILRVVTALVVLAIITGIFVGLLQFSDTEYLRAHGALFIVYWSLLALGTVAVVILAMADYRLVERARHRAQAEIYRQMAELQESLARARQKQQENNNAEEPVESQ